MKSWMMRAHHQTSNEDDKQAERKEYEKDGEPKEKEGLNASQSRP